MGCKFNKKDCVFIDDAQTCAICKKNLIGISDYFSKKEFEREIKLSSKEIERCLFTEIENASKDTDPHYILISKKKLKNILSEYFS